MRAESVHIFPTLYSVMSHWIEIHTIEIMWNSHNRNMMSHNRNINMKEIATHWFSPACKASCYTLISKLLLVSYLPIFDKSPLAFSSGTDIFLFSELALIKEVASGSCSLIPNITSRSRRHPSDQKYSNLSDSTCHRQGVRQALESTWHLGASICISQGGLWQWYM